MDAFVKVGSRHENERINGISHFLEHLNFKGTKKYPTARKLSEVIDAVGGVFNANTGKEHTQYYAQVGSKHLTLAFDVVTDLFLYPTFKPHEIEREKGVIIEEINMYLDDPPRHVLDMVEEGMWDHHALGRYIIGHPENIRGISKQDILDYRGKFYSPANSIVCIAGKFDEVEVRKLVKKYWSSFDGPKDIPMAERPDSAKQKYLSLQSKKTSQAHFVLGFRGLDREDEDNYALNVLAAILGGGMSSRLFTEVRERRGLAYYVQAMAENYQDTGIFLARAGVEIGKIDMALQVVVKELSKAKKSLVSPIELRKNKEYLKGRISLQLEDTESKLAWYLDQVAFRNKIEEPTTWMKKVDAVTPQDIRRVAQKIIRKDNVTVAVVGPYSDRDKKTFGEIVGKL